MTRRKKEKLRRATRSATDPDSGLFVKGEHKRPQTMKGGHEWWRYVYDEYYDCIICPEYQLLT